MLRRKVRSGMLAEARRCELPTFIKPALDKCFQAGVYSSGAALPATVELLPETTPVLFSEPVHWEIEFRCFVLERTVAAMSAYLREGTLVEAEDGSWPASAQETTEAVTLHSLRSGGSRGLPPASRGRGHRAHRRPGLGHY